MSSLMEESKSFPTSTRGVCSLHDHYDHIAWQYFTKQYLPQHVKPAGQMNQAYFLFIPLEPPANACSSACK